MVTCPEVLGIGTGRWEDRVFGVACQLFFHYTDSALGNYCKLGGSACHPRCSEKPVHSSLCFLPALSLELFSTAELTLRW